jgi:hypothetical protein
MKRYLPWIVALAMVALSPVVRWARGATGMGSACDSSLECLGELVCEGGRCAMPPPPGDGGMP